jgi:hypothetical protein
VIAPHQLMLSIHIHMVFVAVVALAMLFCPAHIHVLLHPLRRLVSPILMHFAPLNRRILIAHVVVARHWHDGSVQDLSAAGDVALPIEMPPSRQIALQSPSGQ